MKFMYEDEKTAIQFEIEKMILLVNFLLREHFVKTKLEDFEQKYFFELGYKLRYDCRAGSLYDLVIFFRCYPEHSERLI